MLISIDGDDGGVVCRQLEAFGHVVLRPLEHTRLATNRDQAFRACLRLSWYLMTARATASKECTIFVRGSPTTVDVVECGLGPNPDPFLARAYRRLFELLKREFRPVAYVLVQRAACDRAGHRGVSHGCAQKINSKYWHMYRTLFSGGARTVIV